MARIKKAPPCSDLIKNALINCRHGVKIGNNTETVKIKFTEVNEMMFPRSVSILIP
jgi:hypothetical protein